MNYPDAALADLSAFSHWPDALAASEEIAAWAQPAGYAEPEVAIEAIPFDILLVLDAILAWGQSRTSRTPQTNLVSISAFGMG